LQALSYWGAGGIHRLRKSLRFAVATFDAKLIVKTPAFFLLDQSHWDIVYGPAERKRLEAYIQMPFRFYTKNSLFKDPGNFAEAEVLFSSWGMPRCDEAFLNAIPNLKAIFYAAGTVKSFVTDALWRRGIIVSTANSALAVTVAEFTLAQILLSLKSAWRFTTNIRTARNFQQYPVAGTYDSVVGLISMGAVARHLIALLRHFKLRVVVYDPFLSSEEAQELGVQQVTLEEVFEISHVVSLHTPLLLETQGMIRGHHFSSMRKDATFINTARGALVNEEEMIEVLQRRPDLYALLDVTHPEPPLPQSPLHTIPNVILTPHIAGAMAVEEFERYLKGEPLLGEVREEMMRVIA
jgi:phosphoglycerate dehydrogenase-like enzyme